MVQDIRAVEHRGFDVMLLTETKIKLEVYLYNCLGYGMTCSLSRPYRARVSQGGVGLVTRERLVR